MNFKQNLAVFPLNRTSLNTSQQDFSVQSSYFLFFFLLLILGSFILISFECPAAHSFMSHYTSVITHAHELFVSFFFFGSLPLRTFVLLIPILSTCLTFSFEFCVCQHNFNFSYLQYSFYARFDSSTYIHMPYQAFVHDFCLVDLCCNLSLHHI